MRGRMRTPKRMDAREDRRAFSETPHATLLECGGAPLFTNITARKSHRRLRCRHFYLRPDLARSPIERPLQSDQAITPIASVAGPAFCSVRIR